MKLKFDMVTFMVGNCAVSSISTEMNNCYAKFCLDNNAFKSVVTILHQAVTDPTGIYIEKLPACRTCPDINRVDCVCYRITEDFDVFIHHFPEEGYSYWVLEHDPPFGDERIDMWRTEDNDCEPAVVTYVERFLNNVTEEWFNYGRGKQIKSE